MPNPHIEQLRREYGRHARELRLFAVIFAVLSGLTFFVFWYSPWSFVTGFFAFLFGYGIFLCLTAMASCKRELDNLTMIDGQHVHGKPSPFVDSAPPNPHASKSEDNFWGRR